MFVSVEAINTSWCSSAKQIHGGQTGRNFADKTEALN